MNSDKQTAATCLGQEGVAFEPVASSRAGTGTQHGKKPVTICLPWPAKALHSNARVHWAEKSGAASKARKESWFMAHQAKLPCWPEATILIEYWPPSRRGDPQNVPHSLKAYIDGIADAMGCDDRCFKVDYPRVFAGTKKGGEVVFMVYEL